MPIQMTCPHCNKEYNLAQTMAGKKVRCKACAELFTVEEPEADALAAGGAVQATMPARDMADLPEVLAVDDEDGEEEAPKKKKKMKVPAQANSSGAMLWILLGGTAVVFLMVLCGGGGIGAYFWFSRTGGGVSLENYNKIAIGMTEAEVTGILGSATRTEPPDLGSMGFDKTLVWEKGLDRIHVRFNRSKVVIFDGFFDGKIYLGNNNRQVNNTNHDPFPNPFQNLDQNGENKVTKANFDKIIVGKTTKTGVFNLLGIAHETKQQNRNPNTIDIVETWRNGDSSITITTDSRTQRVIAKDGKNLR